ncbi:hypothetical protein DXT99_03095 [Pontibacter diazotrophicus]|uniref:Uncharacterized protein n=1 Tax=Pontibacter diazotrophicus TaxID=1400979 RepID=A0A3D8LH70_9BACT|nr:hypothetical protein DXT99_03095 [Pontibacter diazotrophicus]
MLYKVFFFAVLFYFRRKKLFQLRSELFLEYGLKSFHEVNAVKIFMGTIRGFYLSAFLNSCSCPSPALPLANNYEER